MEKLKVVVTGAQGFIGSYLLSELNHSDRYKVIPFSGDLLSAKDISNFFKQNPKIDICVHLAGAFEGNFTTLVSSNVLTTHVITTQFPKYGCKKIILSSTGAVYNEKEMGTLGATERSSLLPSTEYALTKKFAEEVLLSTIDSTQTKVIILRFPNVYGSGNTKGVIGKMLENAKNGYVQVFGDGLQERDFLHVNDASSAIIAALSYPESDIFNVSSNVTLSINRVIDELKKSFQFKVVTKPAEKKTTRLHLNFSKAKRLLGYVPTITALRIE